MTYPGYMALANEDGETLELVNAARVKAYTDNLAPSLGLRGCDDCEGLPAALGEEYTTPTADNAPWYDPTDADTAGFYGVYPLDFAGIDDSTREIESAELTGDGSVVVGSRFSGKDVRVSGVAFAENVAALNAGISWLDNALNGTEEGRCFGDRLSLYSSCPPVEVLPPDFAEPYELVTPPSQAELDAWTTTSGTITGSADGIRVDWNPGDAQRIICREVDDLIPGEQYQLRLRMAAFGGYHVRIGESCANARTNLAPNPRLLGWEFTGGAVADFESDVATGGPLGLGWRQAITTSSNTSSPYRIQPPSGERIDVTPNGLYQASLYVLSPVGSARLSSNFYDSDGVLILGDEVLQAGVVMDGTWQRLEGIVEAPVGAVTMEIFAAFSFADGTVQPNMTFGGANLLVEGPNYQVVRTNLKFDPRAEGLGTAWPWSAGVGGTTTSSFVSGAADGPVLYDSIQSPTYRRHEIVTAPTSGSAGPVATTFATQQVYSGGVQEGQRWMAGAFFRSSRAVTGTVQFRLYDNLGVIQEIVQEPFSLDADTWTYITGGQEALSAHPNVWEIGAWLLVGGVGGAAAIEDGDIYETTGGILQIGETDDSYYDSERPNAAPTAYLSDVPGEGLNSSSEVVVDDVGSYFDGFTEGFEWSSVPNDSTSVSSQGIDYETVFDWGTSHEPPTEPTVLDFIPRADSAYLSITPIVKSGSFPLDALVQEVLVRRTERPGVVAFGSAQDVVPPSDGWTHTAPEGMLVDWFESGNGAMNTSARAPSDGTVTYTVAEDGVDRTVFGLRPGSRYRLMIEFDTFWRETDASAAESLDPFVTIENSEGIVVTYNDDNPGTFQYFWVIEFTATSTSTNIKFHPGSDLVIGSQGDVFWSFHEYMVEEILQTDATPPRPGRFQERIMYRVKASQGPILTNVRKTSCGVMGQVSYSLRIGNPFKYRSPIFAGGLPAGTSQTVVDVPCSEDGLPQVINFAYNPSVETDAFDWNAGGLNINPGARVASPDAVVGDYVFQASADDVPSARLDGIVNYYRTSQVTSGPVPQAGNQVTYSIYFRTTDIGSIGTFSWLIYVTMEGFPAFLFEGFEEITADDVGEWRRIEHTFTLPFNVSLIIIEAHVDLPDSVTQGGQIEADGVMIQHGDAATEPFDQTMPNVVWSGDPNTSALLLSPVQEDISEDPDCPTPPSPPSPPNIDDACISDPTAYNRTVVHISEDTVPRNLTAYPVITLTAGAEPVRQARIRFWEDADGLPIEDLGACSYDGEIIISYLAAGATMVIDGVLQEATVSKPGFADQNANHLLYGPDGGPVDWPELSGGIPYLVTLELDSGEGYGDTLMLIDLVVKD